MYRTNDIVDWVTLLYPQDTVDYYWVNLMYTNDTVNWVTQEASWERVFYPVYIYILICIISSELRRISHLYLFEWAGVDIRWVSADGFDTRWIPSRFSCGVLYPKDTVHYYWVNLVYTNDTGDCVTLLYTKDTVHHYWVNLMYTNDIVDWVKWYRHKWYSRLSEISR